MAEWIYTMAEWIYMKHGDGAFDYAEEVEEYANELRKAGAKFTWEIKVEKYGSTISVVTGGTFHVDGEAGPRDVSFWSRCRGYCEYCNRYRIYDSGNESDINCSKCGETTGGIKICGTSLIQTNDFFRYVEGEGVTSLIKTGDLSTIKPVAAWIKKKFRMKCTSIVEDGWLLWKKGTQVLVSPPGIAVLVGFGKKGRKVDIEYADPKAFEKLEGLLY